MTDVEELAARLDRAQQDAAAIPQLTREVSLEVATGYEVQRELLARRTARGERLVGLKMGLTSAAKMAQVGVDEPIWGRLTDRMRVPDGGRVSRSAFIHPRVEPELAFRLDGTGTPTAVAAALEVIDSRYADFQFTLSDVVADNASAAAFVVGRWVPLPAGGDRAPGERGPGDGAPDLTNLGVLLEVDGRVVETGSTAAILGDPWRALARGLDLAARDGVAPEPGWVFLAGAATAAVPLPPGAHVRAEVEAVGAASLTAG